MTETSHYPLFFHHDDLCPEIIDPGGPERCQCDLIARVREDERLTMEAPQLYYRKGYAAALHDAQNAVADIDHGDPCGCDRCLGVVAARKAIDALRSH